MRARLTTSALVFTLALVATRGPARAADAQALARQYADAVRELNEEHRKAPKKATEDELARRLPKAASQALGRLLAEEPSSDVAAALVLAGEAALDLALAEDFGKVRARLLAVDAAKAAELGTAVFRPRFVMRGLGGLGEPYLEGLSEVVEGILEAYDEVFGFAEWSKVPGKKLRFRIHKVERITAPPHFAPEFPFHSEVDFPVVDAAAFASPTADGKFLFYGLCHELGHVIAMWGNRQVEEDHHAWAHYTGVVIVEHLSAKRPAPRWMKDLKDVRWRSLELERKAAKDVRPSRESREGVMALLVALHDLVGPKAVGAAINRVDLEDERLRVNGVRYYTFDALRDALKQEVKGRRERKALEALLGR